MQELFKHRSLVQALAVRHLATRYRGSVLGFFWTLLNPFLMMLVYTVVFRYYLRFNEVDHYSIFLFCGLLPWIWITSALSEGASSISSSGHLITKSSFPAHVLPTVAVLTSLSNFVLSLPVLFVFMALSGVSIGLPILVLPLIVILQLFFLEGLVLITSALNVVFRDVQHLVTHILSLLFFLCPVVYPVASVPERFRFIFELNPFSAFISAYHSVILDRTLPTATLCISLTAWTVLVLVAGGLVFDRYREDFAELL